MPCADSTAQYIRGQLGQLDEDGVTNGGLQCVAVLIGAFQKSSGRPIIGVAVQPFWELDAASQQLVLGAGSPPLCLLLCFIYIYIYTERERERQRERERERER